MKSIIQNLENKYASNHQGDLNNALNQATDQAKMDSTDQTKKLPTIVVPRLDLEKAGITTLTLTKEPYDTSKSKRIRFEDFTSIRSMNHKDLQEFLSSRISARKKPTPAVNPSIITKSHKNNLNRTTNPTQMLFFDTNKYLRIGY